jgi:hypothetical protein
MRRSASGLLERLRRSSHDPARYPSRPSWSSSSALTSRTSAWPRTAGSSVANAATPSLPRPSAMCGPTFAPSPHPAQVALPLAGRPYDLRHAGSLPLAGGRGTRTTGRRAGRAQRRGPAPPLRQVSGRRRDDRQHPDRRRPARLLTHPTASRRNSGTSLQPSRTRPRPAVRHPTHTPRPAAHSRSPVTSGCLPQARNRDAVASLSC